MDDKLGPFFYLICFSDNIMLLCCFNNDFLYLYTGRGRSTREIWNQGEARRKGIKPQFQSFGIYSARFVFDKQD